MNATQYAHDAAAFLLTLTPEQLNDDQRARLDRLRAEGMPLIDAEAESDAEPGPFDDPQELAGFQAWKATGLRVYNTHEAEAIAQATGQPRSFGVLASAWLWRLSGSGTREGWWCKLAPTHADDIGCSVDQFRRIQNFMCDARIVRRKIGRNNVTEYKLDHDALNALTHAYGEGLGVDFKGLAARFEGNPETVKRARERFHGLGETPGQLQGNAKTRIQGKQNEKPPAPGIDTAPQQHASRTPGEDDEDYDDEPGAAAPPAAPAKRAVDHVTSAEILLAYCVANAIRHQPARISNYCHLADVTPDEARALLKAAKDFGEAIDHFNWFKQKLDKLRAPGVQRRSETPVGGVPRKNEFLPVAVAIAREPKADAGQQAQSMEAIRAALRPHCKALTK